MTKAETRHRWFPGWRANPTPPDLDAADYGTAFGLDMSLSALDPEAMPGAPSATSAPLLRPAPAASRQLGWVRRLAARRKPPA